jgi:hypothetical protein
MDGQERGGRLRSFLFGGVVGASAAFAAFEDAPCYRELVDKERAS